MKFANVINALLKNLPSDKQVSIKKDIEDIFTFTLLNTLMKVLPEEKKTVLGTKLQKVASKELGFEEAVLPFLEEEQVQKAVEKDLAIAIKTVLAGFKKAAQ